MGIIIRQGIKSSIVSYVGVVIGTINVLFLYNRYLSPEQLGLYVALTSFPLVFASIAHLGMPHVSVRFFNHFKDDQQQHHGFFAFLLLVPLVGCLLFTVLYLNCKPLFFYFYESNSPLLTHYYYFLLPITILLVYMNVLESYARVHLRIVVPAVVREVVLKLSNSALALLYGLSVLSFDQLVVGIVLMYLLANLLLVAYIAWLGRLYWRIDLGLVRKPIFKEMLQYGAWVLIGGASAVLVPQMEKLILPAYAEGMKNTAIFDIALKISLVIGIPRNAIAQISMPLLAESWKKGDLAHIAEIYRKSSLNLLIVGGFLFLGIWVNIEAIYNLIPKAEVYRAGKWVVLLVGLRQVIDMATGLNTEVIINSKYYRFDLLFYIILAVLLFSANLILIPLYSYTGAAMALLLSLSVYNAAKYWFIKRYLHMQPFDRATLKAIGLLGLAYVLTLAVPNWQGGLGWILLGIVLKSALVSVVVIGGVLWLRLSEDASRLWELAIVRIFRRL